MLQHFDIVGTGFHLPQRRLTAEDVDERAAVPRGWTRAHVGVLERYECAEPETLASMAREAIRGAMRDAALAWRDVDLIVDASHCSHQPIPCNAVRSTCLGFIVALHVANALFAAGAYRHILIVCSEQALLGVDWREPESACLLGDGAAAVMLRCADPRPGYFFVHQTYAQHIATCQIRGGGHVFPVTNYRSETDGEFRFHMDGPQLMRTAAKYLPPMARRLIADSGVVRDALHVVPHQASPRGLAIMRRLLGIRAERFENRVATMGNLISASVPAVLHQCRVEERIAPGQPVLLLGTSAGYSQAGLIFRM